MTSMSLGFLYEKWEMDTLNAKTPSSLWFDENGASG